MNIKPRGNRKINETRTPGVEGEQRGGERQGSREKRKDPSVTHGIWKCQCENH